MLSAEERSWNIPRVVCSADLLTKTKIEMSIKKIKKHNSQQFLDDLARVRDVMVIMPKSNAYLHVTKQELRKEAMEGKIHYYITDKIFRVVRDVMVIT